MMKRTALFFLSLCLARCGEGPAEQSFLPAPDSCYDDVATATALPLNNFLGILNGTLDSGCNYKSVLFVFEQLSDGNPTSCTATLIAPNVALSAAHCFAESPVAVSSQIVMGKLTVKVSRVLNHPNYVPDSDHLGSGTNDIAILFLERRIPLTPIAMPTSGPVAGSRVVNVGYGFDGRSDDGYGKLGARLVGKQIVQSGHGTGKPSTEYPNAIVTVAESDQNSCKGDSGGPLLYNGQIVGVLSGGNYSEDNEKCRASVNSTFTPVVPYLSWIRHHTGI